MSEELLELSANDYLALFKERNALPKGHALKISPSLLNSWKYLQNVSPARHAQAYKEFENTINRIPFPGNVWTERGTEFERLAVEEKVPALASIIELIKDCEYQEHLEGEILVDNIPVYLHGYTDASDNVNQVIYDLKRKNKSSREEFRISSQTDIYLLLKPEAKQMEYLVAISTSVLPIPYDLTFARYVFKREEMGDIAERVRRDIRGLFAFLRANNLFDIYIKNFAVDADRNSVNESVKLD